MWAEQKPHNYQRVLVAAIVLTLVSIALHLVLSSFTLSGGVVSHVAGEAIAATLAGLVGATLISISTAGGQRWIRILGLGLVFVAGLDLLHMVFSTSKAIEVFDGDSVLSDWTSLLSRVVLSAVALGTVLSLARRDTESETDHRPLPIILLPAALVVVLVAASAALALTGSQAPSDLSIETALSLLPGSLFLIAFVIFQHRSSELSFMFSAFGVFLFSNGIADGSFMAYSSDPFDNYYGVFHIFKLFSYGVLLFGILAESQKLYRFEFEARRELGNINDSLNDANLHLTTATNDLKALNQIGRLASESHDLAERFEEIASILESRIRTDRTLVATMPLEAGDCTIEAVYGVSIPGRGRGDPLPLAGTIIGEVVRKRQTLHFDDSNIEEFEKLDPRLVADREVGFRSWLSTPVVAEDEVVGVLMVRTRVSHAYGERETQFLEQVASQIAGLVRAIRLSRHRAA